MAEDVAKWVPEEDLGRIDDLQEQALMGLRSSSDVLRGFNERSSTALPRAVADLQRYTQLLHNMKQDLDYIFLHTRQLKQRIFDKHPELTGGEDPTLEERLRSGLRAGAGEGEGTRGDSG